MSTSTPRKLAGVALVAALCAAAALGQTQSGPRLRLEDLERMALAGNPTIGQAAAAVEAARARSLQAGLYPNPTIGVSGDEIAAGSIIRGGEIGGFVSQRLVTAGKLGLSRRAGREEQRQMEAQADAQRQRVRNAVRALYYQALGDQRRIEVRGELAKLARHAVDISRELANVGQADRPDLLAAEIEAQRIGLALVAAQNARERTWRQLGAVVNQPALQPGPLEGDLEAVPILDAAQALATIHAQSPELRAAQAEVARAELVLRRAQVEKIPDVMVSGGMRYNRELLEQTGGGSRQPVGKEGFFDIGVQIPIFNRNQGNVAAARAGLERSRLNVDRTRLALRSRLAAAYKEYQDAVAALERYRGEMLPKAQQAYTLYLNSFRQMAAAYPQVLIAQRNLFQLQDDYVMALESAWQRAIEIQGMLLTGGAGLMGSAAPMSLAPTAGGGMGEN